jgi:hypothetical protein
MMATAIFTCNRAVKGQPVPLTGFLTLHHTGGRVGEAFALPRPAILRMIERITLYGVCETVTPRRHFLLFIA